MAPPLAPPPAPPALSAQRALHAAAPWRRRRDPRAGGGGAAEGRQPRGGVLRGGGASRAPFPPFPTTTASHSRPFPWSRPPRRAVVPEPLGRRREQRGRSSGPGPAPQVSERPREGEAAGTGPGLLWRRGGAWGGGSAGRDLSGRRPRVSAASRPQSGSSAALGLDRGFKADFLEGLMACAGPWEVSPRRGCVPSVVPGLYLFHIPRAMSLPWSQGFVPSLSPGLCHLLSGVTDTPTGNPRTPTLLRWGSRVLTYS